MCECDSDGGKNRVFAMLRIESALENRVVANRRWFRYTQGLFIVIE